MHNLFPSGSVNAQELKNAWVPQLLRGHLCASDCLLPGRIVFSIFNSGIFFYAAVMTQK